MSKKILIFLLLLINCKVNTDNTGLFGSLSVLFYRANQISVSGTAVKGIAKNAQAVINPINSDGSCNTSVVLAKDFTGDTGDYNLSYSKTGSNVCLTISANPNGTTTVYDEKLGTYIPYTADSSFTIQSILPEEKAINNSRTNTKASPFSSLIAKRFQYLMKQTGSGANARNVYKKAAKELVIRFGLNSGLSASSKSVKNSVTKAGLSDDNYPEVDDINVDFTQPDSPYAAKYIAIMAGFSQLASQIKTGTTTTPADFQNVINGFASDFEDGKFDGKDASGNGISIGSGTNTITFTSTSLTSALLPAIVSYVAQGGKFTVGKPIKTKIPTFTAAQIQALMSFNDATEIISNISLVNPGSVIPSISYGSSVLTLNLNSPVNLVPTITNGPVTSFSVSPALPTGLTLDPTTGIISGTPTVATSSTNYTITATNGSNSGSVILTITTQAPLAAFSLAYSTNTTSAVIKFTGTVKATSAECANQTACAAIYSFNNGLTVSSATMTGGAGVDGDSITLTTSTQTASTTYTLTVPSNILQNSSSGYIPGFTTSFDDSPAIISASVTNGGIYQIGHSASTNGFGTSIIITFSKAMNTISNGGTNCTGTGAAVFLSDDSTFTPYNTPTYPMQHSCLYFSSSMTNSTTLEIKPYINVHESSYKKITGGKTYYLRIKNATSTTGKALAQYDISFTTPISGFPDYTWGMNRDNISLATGSQEARQWTGDTRLDSLFYWDANPGGPLMEANMTNLSSINGSSNVAVDNQGRMYVCGFDIVNSYTPYLLRINANGTLDTSFGTNGYINTPTTSTFKHPCGKGHPAPYNWAPNTRLHYDSVTDKIYISGVIYSGGHYAYIGRINLDGSWDTSFGVDNTLLNDADSTKDGFFVLPNLIAANCCTYGSNVVITDFKLDANRKIVAVGMVKFDNGTYEMVAWRVLADGSGLDTSFNSTGYYKVQYGQFSSVDINPNDGRILIGGYHQTTGKGYLTVLNGSDGSLNTSFQGSDTTTPTPNTLNGIDIGVLRWKDSNVIRTVAWDSNNKIVGITQAGTALNVNGTAPTTTAARWGIFRLNTNGGLDNTFGADYGSDGVTDGGAGSDGVPDGYRYLTGNNGQNYNNYPADMKIKDGNIYVFGSMQDPNWGGLDFAVFKLNNSGKLDLTFGYGGYFRYVFTAWPGAGAQYKEIPKTLEFTPAGDLLLNGYIAPNEQEIMTVKVKK